jgi:hypothetical protein
MRCRWQLGSLNAGTSALVCFESGIRYRLHSCYSFVVRFLVTHPNRANEIIQKGRRYCETTLSTNPDSSPDALSHQICTRIRMIADARVQTKPKGYCGPSCDTPTSILQISRKQPIWLFASRDSKTLDTTHYPRLFSRVWMLLRLGLILIQDRTTDQAIKR